MGKLWTRRDWLVFSGLVVPALHASDVLAQGGVRRGMNDNMSRGDLAALDPILAMQLLIAGRKQIAVCELAMSRLKDEQAKKFAQLEIDEHTQMRMKLNGLGYQYSPGSDGEASSTMPRGSAASFMVQGSPLTGSDANSLMLEHEVKSQCIATQKEEMAAVPAEKFDRRFIDSQLDAHYDLLDHAVTFRRHASGALAPVLDMGKPVIDQHIAMCKELCKKLS